MGHEPGHGYDSFVVRLWHESGTGVVMRAEVEHVQSGLVDTHIGSSWEWIQERLHARLDGREGQEGNS